MSLIIGLFVTAFILFFFEIFVPGGILAFAGGILILMASFLAWTEWGLLWGIVVLGAGMLAALLMFFLEIQFILKSPLRHQLCLKNTIAAKIPSVPDEDLIGKEGVALTTLAPSGKVRIEGKVHIAKADTFIEQGSPVKITQVSPFKLIVIKK